VTREASQVIGAHLIDDDDDHQLRRALRYSANLKQAE
jgi:hypothetical protein